MPQVFSSILLPIDFTPDTEIAVKRAIELIEPAGSTIHLVHIVNPLRMILSNPYDMLFLFSPQRSSYYKQHELKLDQWRQTLAETLDETTVTAEIVVHQSVEHIIISRSKRLKPELVIIGKHSFNSAIRFVHTISPSRIVNGSGCAVLTVKPAKFHSRNQVLVIPVARSVPEKIVGAIASLNRKQNFVIYLVSIPENLSTQSAGASQALLETFRILKRIPNCQVECRVINDADLIKAARRLAASIQADMLLIRPDKEPKILFGKKEIQNHIKPLSGLQVLAEKPYEHNN